MEPLGALKNLVPIKVGGLSLLDGGVSPVVDADGATLGSALLIEVDAHTVAAPGNQGGVHTIAAQGVDCGLTDGMGGELGDVGNIHAIVGKGNCHIGLAAAEGEFHMVALDKALVVIGLEPEHQLTESNNFCHCSLSSCFIYFQPDVPQSRRSRLPDRLR